MRLSLVLFSFFWVCTTLFAQRLESEYRDLIQQYTGGQTEFPVESGRVDILTGTHAIEVEFAHKWKEAIGQSLWYALQTERTPAIVLIKESPRDFKYIVQLGSTLSYAHLEHIQVWIWPDDFEGAAPVDDRTSPPANPGFWMTTSTGTRHNASCRYYHQSNGRVCTRAEGHACNICGG